jgi:hypothetical protein
MGFLFLGCIDTLSSVAPFSPESDYLEMAGP